PLPANASPTALSPGYVAISDPLKEDPEEGPKKDPTDGGDYDKEDESFEDDDDDEEEAFEEDEHLALADSAPLHAIDHVPSAEETELFETDESAAIPPPPQTTVLVSMTRYHMAQISVRSHTPPSLSIKALIIKYTSALTPPLQPPSPLSPLSSHSLGSHPHHYYYHLVNYIFIDTLDASIRAFKGRVMTTVGEVNERVIYLATTQRQNAHEFYVLHKDAQDDRDLLRAQISLLKRERFRELARIRDAERQDGPADAGSSC
nr:hypothetical protein [Tanacetum cinerariifolium]